MPKGNPKIKGSEHEELIRRLIAAGWTSVAISLYMQVRYGYELHDSTIRVYRLKEQESIKKEWPDLELASRQEVFKEKAVHDDGLVDVIGKLQMLIRLQEQRIVIDVKHEEQMGKLFGSTRQELKVMGELLQQYHETLQDWGIVPKAGEEVRVRIGMEEQQESNVMLVDVIDEEDLDSVIEFGRLVAAKSKQLPSPNGHEG